MQGRRYDPPPFRRPDREPQASRWQPRGPVQTREHVPSSSLILHGLAPTVTDEMITNSLRAFRPVSARIMRDNVTGEPRGFGFVNFGSVEDATGVMQTFASQPFVLENQAISINFADGSRRRSPHFDDGRSRGESWGSDRHPDTQRDHQYGEHYPPRMDWICDGCNATNFARRTCCFQCNAPKTAQCKEVAPSAAFRPRHHDDYRDQRPPSSVSPSPFHGAPMRARSAQDEHPRIAPSNVLMVRMLPPEIEEGELQVAFAEFDGVQDIRLIRDRATNLSRGFGFVEFRDIEMATDALKRCEGMVVHGAHVAVSYARDTLSTKTQHQADLQGGPRPESSIMVTAMEQAQWSLAHGRGADTTKTNQVEQDSVAADVSALLSGVAAEVVPHFEEPKKARPLPFETAGGTYVYASEYGLYWDPDSMFYYDAQSKMYHNSFTGVYYRCVNPSGSNADAFKAFVPPLPADDTPFQAASAVVDTAKAKPGLSLSLKKDKKKAPAISFGIKTTALGSAAKIFEKESSVKAAVGPATCHPAPSAVSVTSIGMKRKSADDIAKWSQRQRESKAQANEQAPVQQPVATTTSGAQHKAGADSVIEALTNVPQEVPICLLCRRKFGSLELLRKHEKLSKLHLSNLAKAKENKQHIAAQYRAHEQEVERDAKKQKQEAAPSVLAPKAQQEHKPEPTSSLESGIGGKMLKLMGWKSGQGLGKHGTGITAPIQAAAVGRSETAGLGSKAPITASVDLSEATSDKERRRMLARARYDAES